MKALVAGATGQTGRRIVQELHKRGIATRALVRDVEKAKGILPEGVELVQGDVLDPATVRAALTDCTVLLCATGASPSLDPTGPYKVDYEGNKNLVDCAKQAGISQFVLVSSLCVSRFFHPLNLFWLILHWKGKAEEYLKASGLTYTIVRPGGLRNDAAPDPVVMQGADTLFEGSIPRDTVAQVCVEALLQESARNKIVEVVARADAPRQEYTNLFAAVA
ncbi:SDR family oxidoreductase [Leptolyngbya sp. FACHB-261]|uniref:SDR family oxidoreductase n=1 Tax=Leptolyngbya sp. FACHB-261 TaxID=2692806 RepID=UPI001683CF6A|nr:SDR family oxidoreductase [Leptolyngbya sp. FACHB-261]MBD2101245.1 SDR family oxidoreductase [Leptolyngbya sp. FACHB-261]